MPLSRPHFKNEKTMRIKRDAGAPSGVPQLAASLAAHSARVGFPVLFRCENLSRYLALSTHTMDRLVTQFSLRFDATTFEAFL